MGKYTCLALVCAALAGCGEKDSAGRPDNLLTGNDFETLEGWVGDTQLTTLTQEKAHSGTHSVHVGPGLDYSNGFIGTLGKLSPIRLTQVQVKAWVYVPSGKTATAVVMQLMDPAATDGKPMLWDYLPLDKAASKRGEWMEVEKTISMPANAGPNTKFFVYLWNGGSGNLAYMDDVQILRPK